MLNKNILKAKIDLKAMMNFILKSLEEMNKNLFHDIPHAIENEPLSWLKCSFLEKTTSLPKRIKSNHIDENTLLKKESMSG